MNEPEPIQYHKYPDDYIYVAKRGDYDMPRDIYRYEKNKWVRYDARDKIWGHLYGQIFRGRTVSGAELKSRNIPFLKDKTFDMTTKFLSEAKNGKKKKISKK